MWNLRPIKFAPLLKRELMMRRIAAVIGAFVLVGAAKAESTVSVKALATSATGAVGPVIEVAEQSSRG